MSKLARAIGTLTLGAFAASLLPYRFKRDKETGGYEIGALLWALKKTPGEEQDTYSLELLPLLGGNEKSDEAEEEDLFDIPVAEEIADEAAEAVEDAVEAAKEAAEEAVEEARDLA